MRLLPDREAVLAATGDHPYSRLSTGGIAGLRGYAADGSVAWVGDGPHGVFAGAMGDGATATRLFAALAADGRFGGAPWLHLPRVAPEALAAHFPVDYRDDWEFRWADRPPERVPGEERVVRLGPADDADVTDLLDRAHAGSRSRPGDPAVHGWYGIRLGGRLVACGADRSRGGVGFLAGLTVDPVLEGHGLGTALTAALARRLFAEHEQVALGVMSDNARAGRLYARLGFADALARTSVRLAASGRPGPGG